MSTVSKGAALPHRYNGLINHRGLPTLPLMPNVSFDRGSSGWNPPPELYLNATHLSQQAKAAHTVDGWKREQASYSGGVAPMHLGGLDAFLQQLLHPFATLIRMVIDFVSQSILSVADIMVQLVQLPLDLLSTLVHGAAMSNTPPLLLLILQIGLAGYVTRRIVFA